MAVIKNACADRAAHDAVVLDLGDLKRQADVILQEAREQARDVIERGRIEARKLTAAADARGYTQGFERGRLEGLDAGRAEATQHMLAERAPQLDALLAQWAAAVERWNTARADMLIQAQEDVLAFAIALATRVTYSTIECDPEAVRDQVRAALNLLARPTSVIVRINPADREVLDLALPDLVAALVSAPDISLRDDPAVSRGGCIISTEGGQIDATIETQLQRIVESMLPMRSPKNPMRRIEHGIDDQPAMS